HSEKTNRGPLKLGWVQSAQSDNVPVTTAHKVAKMEFKVFGFQRVVEKYGVNVCRGVMQNAIRQQFCWIDEYYGWSLEDVQKFESKEAEEAKKLIVSGPLAIDPTIEDESTNSETPPSVPQDSKQLNEKGFDAKDEAGDIKDAQNEQ
ncbi:MAG: hypothetical protein EZS28_048252, partial [Streblomastix strix]